MSKKILLRGDIKLAQQYVGFARKKATKWQLFASDQQRTIVRRYKFEDEGVDIHIKALPHRAYINIEAGKLTFSFFVWDQAGSAGEYMYDGYGIEMPTSIEVDTSITLHPIFQNVRRGDIYESDTPIPSHFCFDETDYGRYVNELALFNPESTEAVMLWAYYSNSNYPYWKCSEYEKYNSNSAFGLTRGSGFPASSFDPGYITNVPRYQGDPTILYSSYAYWNSVSFSAPLDSFNNPFANGYTAEPRAAYLTRTERDFFKATSTADPIEIEFPMVGWDHNELTLIQATDAENRLWYSVKYDQAFDNYHAIIRTSLTEYEKYRTGEITEAQYNAQIEVIDYDADTTDSPAYFYYFPAISEPSSLGQTNAYLATDITGNDPTYYFYVEETGGFVEKATFSWDTIMEVMTSPGNFIPIPAVTFSRTLTCVSPTEFYWAIMCKGWYSYVKWVIVVKIAYNTELETPAWEMTIDKEYDATAQHTYFSLSCELMDRFLFVSGVKLTGLDGNEFFEVYDVVTKQSVNMLDDASYNGTNLRNLIPGGGIPRYQGYSG